MQKCDDCPKETVAECAECRGKAAARADMQFDRLRDAGFRSVHHERLVMEAEERTLYPFGR